MAGIYVHIPYCKQKCNYCDFYSCANSSAVTDNYVSAVCFELLQLDKIAETFYFGGGTPSLLTPIQVKKILSYVTLAPNAEVTLEANPDTVTLENMRGYREAGINRISLGVQTASNESLVRLGRTHTAQQAKAAFEAIHNAGFSNISGDIMLSLPNYTTREFDETLRLIANGNATHISCYILTVAENTVFGKKPLNNMPTEDESADFYLYAVSELEKAGYKQYEISNFAKNGFESKHNLTYWNCGDYYGVGAAAHGCVDNLRYYHEPSVKAYISRAEKTFDGVCDAEDFIICQLRLVRGLYFSELRHLWQTELSERQLRFLKKCEAEGLCVLTHNCVRLTVRGMLLQNSILCALL